MKDTAYNRLCAVSSIMLRMMTMDPNTNDADVDITVPFVAHLKNGALGNYLRANLCREAISYDCFRALRVAHKCGCILDPDLAAYAGSLGRDQEVVSYCRENCTNSLAGDGLVGQVTNLHL
jgi:hypothetical protein